MANNCLITTLKAVVDNPNLKPMSKYFTVTKNFSDATSSAFVTDVIGKYGLFRLLASDSADGNITYATNPLSISATLKSNKSIHINIDFRKATGTLYGNLDLTTGGEFIMEILENSFYVSDTDIKNNYGLGGYGIYDNGYVVWNPIYHSTNVVSEFIPTTKTLQFVSEGLNKNIHIFKYGSDGTTYLGEEVIQLQSLTLDLSSIDASYVRIIGSNSDFTNNILFEDVQ